MVMLVEGGGLKQKISILQGGSYSSVSGTVAVNGETSDYSSNTASSDLTMLVWYNWIDTPVDSFHHNRLKSRKYSRIELKCIHLFTLPPSENATILE